MIIQWKAYLYTAAVISAVAAFLIYGQAQYKKGHAAATAKISAELAETAKKQAAQQHAADAAYQETKAKQQQQERVQYVEVEKIIERPVYRNVCFDADGVRELNKAIAR